MIDFEIMEAGEDGWSDWIHPLPGYLMKCCDCGLVHEMQVAIEPQGDEPTTLNDGESDDGVVIFRMRRSEPTPVVEPCENGLQEAIREFRAHLPGWWFSLGECEVSCDASCAPTRLSPDIALIDRDERFNDGFHVDIAQPSTLADALRHAMCDALEAKAASATTS